MSVVILVAVMVVTAVVLAITWIEPKVLGGPAAAKDRERPADSSKPTA